MKPCEIAQYLSISEDKADWLIRSGIMPGFCENGVWEASETQIDEWYATLSAKQWATLVNDGVVQPIAVSLPLGSLVTPEVIMAAFSLAVDSGMVSCVGDADSPSVGSMPIAFSIDEALRNGQRSLDEIRNDCSASSTCQSAIIDQIRFAAQCEMLLGQQTVLMELFNDEIALRIENELEHLCQREREVIRVYLVRWADSLVATAQRIARQDSGPAA